MVKISVFRPGMSVNMEVRSHLVLLHEIYRHRRGSGGYQSVCQTCGDWI